jgi:hypothetical protein
VNDISFEEIENLDCESRYEIFLQMVAEERDVWILINEKSEFLTIHSEDHEIEYLPVWPHSDFTKHHSTSTSTSASEKLTAKCVSIPEFFAKWISGLEGDGLQVGVFPTSASEVWIMEPSEVKSDLQEEFSNFGI